VFLAEKPNRNRRWRLLLIPLVCFLLYAFLQSSFQSSSQDKFNSPADFSDFSDAVTSGTFQLNCNGEWSASGWGIELESRFFVVTAQHVVNDCLEDSRFYARNDSVSMFEVELVSYDGRYWLKDFLNYRDLALLESKEPIPVLDFQATNPELGQWVATVGYPGDSDQISRLSMTSGTITALGSEGFIITDAAINGGNSGGPLVNSAGKVVGTVFASEPSEDFENMGFVQGMVLHCQVILDCADGTLQQRLTKEFLQFDFVD
jgi:S1-C subfamily serine protease